MEYFKNLYNEEIVASFNTPSKLSSLAACAVIKLLVYEDYEDCNFYRWDPVIIWQFETHQPKKKKASKRDIAEITTYGHPPAPWKGVQKLRNWWFGESKNYLGHPSESLLRPLLIEALERQSWTSYSEEEDILFLLLHLCMDTHLHFATKCINENWFTDIAQILDNLGPYPLQKIIVENDVFQGNTLILTTILNNSPNLTVLRISQWELSNEILLILSTRCLLLQEFSIHDMEPDVFMSQDAFFKCFFKGMNQERVRKCYDGCQSMVGNKDCDESAIVPELSFQYLRYVDILFCVHTESLLVMLAYFYPKLTLSTFNVSHLEALGDPYVKACVKMPFVRYYGNTLHLRSKTFHSCLRYSPSPKELRLDIDYKYDGLYSESLSNRVLEDASFYLKEIFREIPSIDSLVLRPHSQVNITKLVLPTFGAYGTVLRSLYFVYDLSSVLSNTIYQLLNLCPLLEKLIIELDLNTRDDSSNDFRTELRILSSLETLVFLEKNKEEGMEEGRNGREEDHNDNSEENSIAHNILLKDVLSHSPNLRNLSIYLWDNLETDENVSYLSNSVERLQLNIKDDRYSCNLSSLLPRFPSLKCLSVQVESRDVWSETLESISRKGLSVTKKKQEFTNVFRWDDKRHNFTYNSNSDNYTTFWCS